MGFNKLIANSGSWARVQAEASDKNLKYNTSTNDLAGIKVSNNNAQVAHISFYSCLYYFILPDDEKALGLHIGMKFQSYSDGNEQKTFVQFVGAKHSLAFSEVFSEKEVL